MSKPITNMNQAKGYAIFAIFALTSAFFVQDNSGDKWWGAVIVGLLCAFTVTWTIRSACLYVAHSIRKAIDE